MLNITFQQLEIFLEVAKRLNITAVAEELYVTQSAVSRSILRLENSLGFTLFERNRRGLKLTSEGKFLYEKLQLHFSSICHTIAELQNNENSKSANLRIGYPNTIDSNKDYEKLNRFIREYKTGHSGITFLESVYNFNELKEKLRYEELDVVFLPNFTMYDQNDMNTDSIPVCKFRLNIAVSKNNPAIRPEGLDLEMLRKQPLYTMGSRGGGGDALTAFLKEINYENAPSVLVPNHDTLLRSIRNNDWGFVLIGNQRFDESIGIRLFPTTKKDYTITLHMVWRTDNDNIELRRFIHALSENKHNLSNF